MIIFAPALMRIFGPDFEVGWPVLVIGTLGQLVNCAVGSVGYLLLMSGQPAPIDSDPGDHGVRDGGAEPAPDSETGASPAPRSAPP